MMMLIICVVSEDDKGEMMGLMRIIGEDNDISNEVKERKDNNINSSFYFF